MDNERFQDKDYSNVHVTLFSANVRHCLTLAYVMGRWLFFSFPSSNPPVSPFRTSELIVCLILKKYYGSEKRRLKQKVGWNLGGGGGGKAAVEGAIFSTSISLKNITHCRLRVWWKRQISVVCRNASFSIQSHSISLPVVSCIQVSLCLSV